MLESDIWLNMLEPESSLAARSLDIPLSMSSCSGIMEPSLWDVDVGGNFSSLAIDPLSTTSILMSSITSSLDSKSLTFVSSKFGSLTLGQLETILPFDRADDILREGVNLKKANETVEKEP
ncbi:DNA repair protein, putative [Babesia ovis]|uniref:DNA repair protein, putative n=1 Tax=Babesia ovis TaxID=5869 RepID=A0A9W5WUT3_BABOV|nr:DNA repair protein, putative [Babesia ovis]